MACNENIIKNIAYEITRNCQTQGCSVAPEFVAYLIELLLLNPRYGKLFAKTLSRTNLEFFVNTCVSMLTKCDTSIITLKMQHLILTNYDKPQVLIEKHLDSIDTCLRPLVSEILDTEPELSSVLELNKLLRKMSIYIVLASGLGNPGTIMTLKEGLAALESVFSLDDLKVFVQLPRTEKLGQLHELLSIVSGVRLFNKDCKKGGETIPDLAYKLVEAGKGCISSLSNSLMAVMERVNKLTSAVEDSVIVEEDGTVCICKTQDLTIDKYKSVFDLLTFNRQHELLIRKLLSDVESMVLNGTEYVDRFKQALDELHSVMKYKTAVPVTTVFPLFTKLWQIWRSMQSEMFLVSTSNKIMNSLHSMQELVVIPQGLIEKMSKGKQMLTDQDRMTEGVTLHERLSLASMKNYVSYNDSFTSSKDRNMQYLGFCALCLCVGSLVPSNMRLGFIKFQGKRFGFCNVKMAANFGKDPPRYINELLEYARNNPQLINLLSILEEVYAFKDLENIVTRPVPKLMASDKGIQTEVHPMEGYIKKNYTWNMWDVKRKACQWASIVNCVTHSTQTKYSHLRSEIHVQTVEARDKCLQTMKDVGVNASAPNKFIWGLGRLYSDGQHYVDLSDNVYSGQKKQVQKFTICEWPCVESSAPAGLDDVSSEYKCAQKH